MFHQGVLLVWSLVLLAVWLFVSLRVVGDAKRGDSEHPYLWGVLVFVGGFVTFALYLVERENWGREGDRVATVLRS